ncbi:urease accessory protein UreD [Neobacillus vireti]
MDKKEYVVSRIGLGEMWTGYLSLIASKKGNRTILKDSYSEGAFKITRPVYLTTSGEAYFYIMNPGGGYVDGDTYKINIGVEEAASAVVTTQSSTKIYKTRNRPAFQETNIYLKNGSVLEYLPDPVIAYQNARFKQTMVVKMEVDASFLCSDIFTPGWAPDGTLFQYDFLQSKMEIYMGDRLVLFDHVKLQPDKDIDGIGMMEGYTHFGSLIVIDHRINSAAVEELQERFDEYLDARIGISMLGVPGFAVRVLANSTQGIEKVQSICHETIRRNILKTDPVFLRKY